MGSIPIIPGASYSKLECHGVSHNSQVNYPAYEGIIREQGWFKTRALISHHSSVTEETPVTLN